MKELTYKGSVVNEAITGANNVIDNFSSLSSEMKQATSQILNARGFQEYVGGISSDSFSSVVEEAKKEFSSLVHNIRQQQVKILAYSEDKEEIKSFLDGLSRNDYNELDLTGDMWIELEWKETHLLGF